jgi:hypothetical protein
MSTETIIPAAVAAMRRRHPRPTYTSRLSFMCSPEQYTSLCAAAAQAGLPVGVFLRHAALAAGGRQDPIDSPRRVLTQGQVEAVQQLPAGGEVSVAGLAAVAGVNWQRLRRALPVELPRPTSAHRPARGRPPAPVDPRQLLTEAQLSAVRALLANPTNTLEDVAVAVGVCVKTLRKYLPTEIDNRDTTQGGPGRKLRQTQLAAACTLLADPAVPLETVAATAGVATDTLRRHLPTKAVPRRRVRTLGRPRALSKTQVTAACSLSADPTIPLDTVAAALGVATGMLRTHLVGKVPTRRPRPTPPAAGPEPRHGGTSKLSARQVAQARLSLDHGKTGIEPLSAPAGVSPATLRRHLPGPPAPGTPVPAVAV